MVKVRQPLRAGASARVMDVAFLRRAFLVFGLLMMLVTPFTHDPLAFAVGSFMPWVLLSIVTVPAMPVALVYYFLWQWAQAYARVLQSLVDGEPLGGGLYGPTVVNAYWYALASVLVLALAFRAVLGALKPPTPEEEFGHLKWRPQDLFLLYCGTLLLAVVCSYAARIAPGLSQQFDAAARLKIVAEFLLFATVLSSGRGGRFLIAAVLFEILIGFTGLLSDFRSVFFYLAFAAIAARLSWNMASIVGGIVWLAVLMSLALFWTAVKADFREYATGGEETQNLSVPLAERLSFLGRMAASPGDIKWGEASYLLLIRFAYIDIFGSVIAVQDARPQSGQLGQFQAAFDHVFKPRIFFPDKASLSDTEVYVRLTGADPGEVMRESTSISVGYMAETYVDLGFPGMLVAMLGLGLIMAWMVRYFMQAPLPWMVRQGIVLAFIYNVGGLGMEMSLPKLLGASVMFFLVFVLLIKFALPIGLNWLHGRPQAEVAQPS